jgi:hypothetical protein
MMNSPANDGYSSKYAQDGIARESEGDLAQKAPIGWAFANDDFSETIVSYMSDIGCARVARRVVNGLP